MVKRLFTSMAAYASLIALVITFYPNDQPLSVWAGILIGVFTCFFIANLIVEFLEYRNNRPLAYTNEDQINEYMYKWISKGRRVVIFTRDMSWVNSQKIRELLMTKAQNDELTICMPKEIPLATELRNHGAIILVYPELDFIPQCRFTIVNKDRMDAKVAVGREVEGKHVIEEFGQGEHPIYSMADDLVEVISKYNYVSKYNNLRSN